MNLLSSPHRRFNPLLKSWVLVSPQRIYRPWAGKIEQTDSNMNLTIISNNALQPNALRSNGTRNPNYTSVYIFKNDFPALLDTTHDFPPISESNDFNFFQFEPAKGNCDVMCFHPSSDVTLATMELGDVINVINQWILIIEQTAHKYEWIQIFENRGELMGCSNRHPHCQIWSTNFLPTTPSMKETTQLEYFQRHNRPMLFDYVTLEIAAKERIVDQNENWVCLVPFWAEWPFETMIIPRRIGVHRFTDLTSSEVTDLAMLMQILLRKYDKLFDTAFPYSMGWHGAPTGTRLLSGASHWTLHAIYYPPLLRGANVRKFFVGYELLAETQRDLTAERAAETLRNVLLQ